MEKILKERVWLNREWEREKEGSSALTTIKWTPPLHTHRNPTACWHNLRRTTHCFLPLHYMRPRSLASVIIFTGDVLFWSFGANVPVRTFHTVLTSSSRTMSSHTLCILQQHSMEGKGPNKTTIQSVHHWKCVTWCICIWATHINWDLKQIAMKLYTYYILLSKQILLMEFLTFYLHQNPPSPPQESLEGQVEAP